MTGTKQSPETDPKETKALDLLVKDFKIAVINMLKELKENMNKEIKDIRKVMNKMRISTKRYKLLKGTKHKLQR